MDKEDNDSIKIAKLSDMEGSYFNDRVWVKVSPSWLNDIMVTYRQMALMGNDYTYQGVCREKADFFTIAYDKWNATRHGIYEESNTKKDDAVKSLLLNSDCFSCIAPETTICMGKCITSGVIRALDKNTFICPYLRYEKGD